MHAPAVLPVLAPATGARLGAVPDLDARAVAEQVARARAAQPAWSALGFRARARLLRALRSRLVRDPDLPRLIASEAGKPAFEAEFMEVLYTAELIRHLAGGAGRRALADTTRAPFFFPHKRTRLVRHPRGVIGVIGPFNWPLLNNFADAVAPLLAGNAVVLKPSPLTPLTSLRVAELWRGCGLPPDVLQVATGEAATGEALCREVDMVMFTGGLAGGRAVARTCAERLIPAVLELGGKNPAVVLEDADLDDAAHALAWAAYLNTGQACIHIERALVVDAVADALVERLARIVDGLRQGASAHACPPDFELGALVRRGDAAVLRARIDAALAAGARLVRGPGRDHASPTAGPVFFPPTLVDHVAPEMELARSECFGPVLSIVRVRDEDEAIRQANALDVGLTASVFSRDRARARRLARRLEVGTVCIDDAAVHYFCVESPLGGWKHSGLGHRHGAESLLQFTRTQVLVEDRPALGWLGRLVRHQLGYPYRAHVARALRWLARRLYG